VYNKPEEMLRLKRNYLSHAIAMFSLSVLMLTECVVYFQLVSFK